MNTIPLELTDDDSFSCLEAFKLKYGGDRLKWISSEKDRLCIVSVVSFHLVQNCKQGESLLDSASDIDPGSFYMRGAIREIIDEMQNLNKRHLLGIASALLISI